MAAIGALPFCVGATAFSAGDGDVSGPSLWPCPFRTVTGLPCPLCGGTRSVVLAVHGQAEFWALNPVVPLALAALVVAGVAILVAGALRLRGGRGLHAVLQRRRGLLAAFVLGAGWIVALAHRAAITG
jgi:hypothetical protein